LLIKLLEFLTFEKQELNEFFQQFFTMFIMQKPDGFDPLTKYFIQIVGHMAADIQLAASTLEQIEPIDCCFFVVSTLVAMLTGIESPLDRAAIEFRWLITEFEFDDPTSMLRVGQGLSYPLEFLANVQSSDHRQKIEIINICV
jgi:hypothetical protein